MERSKERRRKTVVWASCSWTSSPVGTMLRDQSGRWLPALVLPLALLCCIQEAQETRVSASTGSSRCPRHCCGRNVASMAGWAQHNGCIPAGSLPPCQTTFCTSPSEESRESPSHQRWQWFVGGPRFFLVAPASHPASSWTSQCKGKSILCNPPHHQQSATPTGQGTPEKPLPRVATGPFWGQEWWELTFGLRLDLGRAGLGHIDNLLTLGIVQGFLQDAGTSLQACLSTAASPALKLVLAVSWMRGERHQNWPGPGGTLAPVTQHRVVLNHPTSMYPPPNFFFQLQGILHLSFLLSSLQVPSR